MSLGCYKCYQSQTPGDVPARRLSPKRGWTRGGVPNKDAEPRWGELWDPTSVGEENEIPFIRVWKPLSSRCILKTFRESSKRTISASGGLELLHKGSHLKPFIVELHKNYHIIIIPNKFQSNEFVIIFWEWFFLRKSTFRRTSIFRIVKITLDYITKHSKYFKTGKIVSNHFWHIKTQTHKSNK